MKAIRKLNCHLCSQRGYARRFYDTHCMGCLVHLILAAPKKLQLPGFPQSYNIIVQYLGTQLVKRGDLSSGQYFCRNILTEKNLLFWLLFFEFGKRKQGKSDKPANSLFQQAHYSYQPDKYRST